MAICGDLCVSPCPFHAHMEIPDVTILSPNLLHLGFVLFRSMEKINSLKDLHKLYNVYFLIKCKQMCLSEASDLTYGPSVYHQNCGRSGAAK